MVTTPGPDDERYSRERVEAIDGLPLAQRAAAYAALQEELAAELEGSDAARRER